MFAEDFQNNLKISPAVSVLQFGKLFTDKIDIKYVIGCSYPKGVKCA